MPRQTVIIVGHSVITYTVKTQAIQIHLEPTSLAKTPAKCPLLRTINPAELVVCSIYSSVSVTHRETPGKDKNEQTLLKENPRSILKVVVLPPLKSTHKMSYPKTRG